MKIAVFQANPIIGDLEGNKEKIIRGYKKAKEDGADLVIFPELFLPGYPPLDLVEKEEFRKAVSQCANDIADKTEDAGLIFGSITEDYQEVVGTGVYNSALLCYDGKIQFVQSKSLIPNYDVFDEVRYFEPAKKIQVHHFKGEILGISVCEDIWNDADYWKKRRYEIDPVQRQVDLGASLLINISASPYSYGKRKQRYDMLNLLTKNDRIPLVYVCCVGAQTDLIFDGASMCFDDKGRLCMMGKAYEEDYFIYDTSANYEEVVNIESSFEKEALDALVMGLRDYGRKTGFRKALVGLSGGIDSAMVTFIAVQAFGKENVHVVLMPSQYSSRGSIDDSLKLIENLGISHNIISIQPVYDKILEMLDVVFKGKPRDVTEENIQARIRGVYLMAVANKFGYLLCTTGNKSELAVGYSTLYGDMCGALEVIGDVYKTQVYKLAKYINRNGEIIPEEIITKAPSAELRPDQKDQDTLPPYEILDRILQLYLEEQKEINEINEEINDYDTVYKVLRMVDLNEFKRKQAPPVLRISTKAFGYGRRYPIVQGWRK
ncbi:NAD+ synthase [Melioribacter sp. Ez-97]|uniref:NAD+ synthase n=1 Tax=Melioribacter sp. Ez-97 TaxID=3423434 RepID=UPI003EDAB0A9